MSDYTPITEPVKKSRHEVLRDLARDSHRQRALDELARASHEAGLYDGDDF
jgi:hypothetical protein